MDRTHDRHLDAIQKLAETMEALANHGDEIAIGNGHWELNGLLRDYAYSLRTRVAREHDRLRRIGQDTELDI